MSESVRNSTKHIKLFLPGPVEVLPEILDAQSNWMIGHRMPECLELIAGIKPKLQQVFFTKQRVLFQAGTGTGFWEGASRNCVRNKVLHCTSGAFSDKWLMVSNAVGKETEELAFEWGQPLEADVIADRLSSGEFDALAVVLNETSTGIVNPIKEIAAAVRALPNGQDITIMVDGVSGLAGCELRFDEWDLDIALCSSQKAFAMPPGLAMCAVSDRAMAKAKTIPNRGYYWDFIALAKSYDKDQTPNTSPLPMLYALDVQLDRMLAEGMENRFARHIKQRDMVINYVESKGFELYGNRDYASPVVSNVANNLNIDINDLNRFLRTKNMILSNGYGALKGKAMRIAHMGDITASDLEELFAAMDEYLDR